MNNDNLSAPHQPVLYHEIIDALKPKSQGRYLDGTIGAGGHARGILEESTPGGQLIGMDLDPEAIQLAKTRLEPYTDRFLLVNSSYANLLDAMSQSGWDSVDGILLDLGVSSMQLDRAGRGFSFREEGPLDMRFNPESERTAEKILNYASEGELFEILSKYGEEPKAKQIARAICQARPLNNTLELAEIVKKASGYKHSRTHPATRTFQAIRIATNQELLTLESTLPKAVSALTPGGRIAIISFHSLEDRLVKQFFKKESHDCICPPHQPICNCEHRASIKVISRRPIQASETEIKFNPRARSARLRIAEKL